MSQIDQKPVACDCKKNTETEIIHIFKDKYPEATDHQVELKGYCITFRNGLSEKPCMPYEMEASFPLKKGGVKSKKIKGSIIFSFCPFCGVKL